MHHIMASSALCSMRGLGHITIDGSADKLDLGDQNATDYWIGEMLKGKIAAIYAELPGHTWFMSSDSDPSDFTLVKERSKKTPWGRPDMYDKNAEPTHQANNITRNVITLINEALKLDIPALMVHTSHTRNASEGITCWELPELHHIASLQTASTGEATHDTLGPIKFIPTAAEVTRNDANIHGSAADESHQPFRASVV